MHTVQSLGRAFGILRAVAHAQGTGARLKDLTVLTGLSQGTVFRLLGELQAQGMVRQHAHSRRYVLGSMVAELGLTATAGGDYDFATLCRPSVARIAADTGDTAFVSKRSGMDLLCLDRRSGAHLYKIFTLDVGVRRPLGMGASGIALLLHLPESEVLEILRHNANFLCQADAQGRQEAEHHWRQARQQGYVARDVPNVDVRSVAVPIRDRRGQPQACLSVSAARTRLRDQRLAQVVSLLQREAHRLEDILQAQGDEAA
ncbi:helix-turn-helix domain-containing protein [Bordetella petrii]|nr:helix-turn-helix domain-containing protein [Bordetella petrii]